MNILKPLTVLEMTVSDLDQMCKTGTPPDCSAPDGIIDVLDIMVIIDMTLGRQDCCSFYYTGVIY